MPLQTMSQMLLVEHERGGKTGTLYSTLIGVALVLGVLTLLVKNMIPKLKLNEEALKRKETEESVRRFTATAVVGCLFNTILGPSAAIMATYISMTYDRTDHMRFAFTDSAYTEDPFTQRLYYTIVLIGELFGGYTIHQTVFWIIGWDKGLDTILHHIGFLTVTFIVVPTGAYIQLGLWAIAMEISTPPLMYYLSTRQLYPARVSTDVAAYLFSFLFIVFRVVIFSYVYLSTLFTLWSHPSLFPTTLSTTSHCAVLSLLGLGLVLQLYWSKAIFVKLKGIFV
eukprot:TRINITY_DN3467_c0_g2_i1.p1 TRINITY_DN3467_c0_g2~~TRINITY_DN3467_c0_g2_i1.p1  ORF type:complete len:293 (+),score=25.19 TRINITY_DN3467_c0_g2_i1:35-880(+)